MRRFRVELTLCLLLAVGTLFAFGPVLRCRFVNFDDGDYVTHNSHVQSGLTAANVRWAFTDFDATANWHPLTWLSLQADRTLYGNAEAFGFHLTNMLLHTASTLLLFLIFRAWTGAVWRSALVAALFAVHPLHVESVAWVSERKDVLSTFFWLLTMAAYGWYVRRPGVLRYLAVVVALSLGLMAKPMLVTLPCVLLLLDYWPLRRVTQQRAVALVAEKLPLFALAAASCIVTWKAQQSGKAVKEFAQFSPAVRAANAVYAYGDYLYKAVRPEGLAAFYPHPGEKLSVGAILLSAVLLAAATAGCLLAARRYPFLPVGWLWYLGTLLPVIGLVQVGEQAMADRYSYVPLIGVFVMVAWGAGELARRWPFLRGALALTAIVALGACGFLAWKQAGTWHDSRTLWTHALDVTEDNWLAHINLALAYGADNPEAAVEHLRKALQIRPNYPTALFNLGLYLAMLAQREDVKLSQREEAWKEAEACFRAILADSPRNYRTRRNLALLLSAEERLDEAREQFEQATQHGEDSDKAKAWHGLGEVLVQLGEWCGAAECFRKSLELPPELPRCRYSLAAVLEERGEAAEAREQYQEAFNANPELPHRAREEAWRLAADRHASPALRNWAVYLARQACHGEETDAEALDTLAVCLAAAGRFPEAVLKAERALKVAEAAGQKELADQICRRLELFRAGRPFHP
jgi:tetratricopeptide (TPR) repeat protein